MEREKAPEQNISYLGISKRAMICRSETDANNFTVFMEVITPYQEAIIEKYKSISDLSANKDFNVRTINNVDIYLYGDVDLTNKNDLRQIAEFNLIDRSVVMPTKFKYNTGTSITTNGVVTVGSPDSPIDWFRFCHTKLGKPKKVIVYRIKTINL